MELLWIISCVAVNCYVMITGYFLINKKDMRWNGILRTWLQTSFYSLLFLLIASLLGVPIAKNDLLASLFPIYNNGYWFITTYIALLLVAPFLSILASSLSKHQYKILLGVLFCLCFQFLYGRVYAGFRTLSWFSFLYLLAGFIKIYSVPSCWKRNSFKVLVIIWIALMCLATIYNTIRGGNYILMSSAYDGPILFLSTSVFVFFLQRPCENSLSVMLKKIAPYTLGIYLIHCNIFVKYKLWDSVIPDYYELPIIFHCILMCSLIFITCVLIDYIRMLLFKLLRVDSYIEKICSKLPQLRYIQELNN